jgi:phosphoribosylformylglycinamidine synthase PurS subunit
MKFRAHINIMPRPELLDPQGKATTLGLHNLGFETMDNLRIGKRIALEVEANTKTEAESKVDEACKKLLANLIMESYEFQLEELN